MHSHPSGGVAVRRCRTWPIATNTHTIVSLSFTITRSVWAWLGSIQARGRSKLMMGTKCPNTGPFIAPSAPGRRIGLHQRASARGDDGTDGSACRRPPTRPSDPDPLGVGPGWLMSPEAPSPISPLGWGAVGRQPQVGHHRRGSEAFAAASPPRPSATSPRGRARAFAISTMSSSNSLRSFAPRASHRSFSAFSASVKACASCTPSMRRRYRVGQRAPRGNSPLWCRGRRSEKVGDLGCDRRLAGRHSHW